MQSSRAYWPAWAKRLQYWNLSAFAVWLLEAGGPFTLLSAQALYFSRPFIGGEQIEALALILEEGNEVQALAHFLRRETFI